MKCQKICYMSPLTGSVECEELFERTYSRVGFGAEAVCQLYHRQYEIEKFLEDNCEDLTEHLPEELRRLVVKAVFGKYHEERCRAYLVTEIYTRIEPTEEQEEAIRDWIMGQFSDGWGEGWYDTPAFEEEVDKYSTEFDPYMCSFEEECYAVTAYYYLSAYDSDNFELIRMTPTEEVELDIKVQEPVVHSSSCQLNDDRTYTVRTVYYIEDKLSAIQFLENSGLEYNAEVIRLINEQGCLGPKVSFYAVHENIGLVSKFLPIVGIANEDTDSARLFTIDEQSGEIDFMQYENDYKHFFWKLQGK